MLTDGHHGISKAHNVRGIKTKSDKVFFFLLNLSETEYRSSEVQNGHYVKSKKKLLNTPEATISA